MNVLIVGTTDKAVSIKKNLPESFLLIDDGEIIDALDLPKRRKVIEFDYKKHSFNPLKDIDYRKAQDFVSIFQAIFSAGENTLTKESAETVLLEALLSKPQNLQTLIRLPRSKDPGELYVYQKLKRLLLSPVLERVLCNRTTPTNFSFDGILLARLNRAELGDFDCFVLANLLIANYKGQVVIPDFGFYACLFHTSLIRQERLIAGVNFLDETRLRNQLLLIDEKHGQHCTAEDAETLAGYSDYPAHTDGWWTEVQKAMKRQ